PFRDAVDAGRQGRADQGLGPLPRRVVTAGWPVGHRQTSDPVRLRRSPGSHRDGPARRPRPRPHRSLLPPAQRPVVTGAQTVAFDPFSAEFFDDPYPIYRRLRDEAPVFRSERLDFYALSRHEDVAAAFKDFETYSSARGVTLDQVTTGEVIKEPLVQFMDPPEHRRMRGLVNKVFTPRAVLALEAIVRA